VPPGVASIPKKPPSKRLAIINPETGENVLKNKDDSKATDDASKKDESKTAATQGAVKDPSASSASSSQGGKVTSSSADAEAASVRHEFQSKIQELLSAKSKGPTEKAASTAATAAATEKAAPTAAASGSSPADDVTTTVTSPEDGSSSNVINNNSKKQTIIHSESSLSNSSSNNDVTTSSSNDQEKQKTGDNNSTAAKVTSSDQQKKPETNTTQKQQPETEVAASPVATPVKAGDSSSKLMEGLEPVSPTPLPETPSTKKDIGASKSSQPENETSAKPNNNNKKSAASKKAELNRKGAEKAMGNEMDVFTMDSKAAEEKKETEEVKATVETKQQPESVSNHVSSEAAAPAPTKATAAAASDSLLSSSTSSLTSTEASVPALAAAVNSMDLNGTADSTDGTAQAAPTAAAATPNNHVSKEEAEPAATPTSSEVATPTTTEVNNKSSEASTPADDDQSDDVTPQENGTSVSGGHATSSGSQIKQLKYLKFYKEGQWSPNNTDGKKQYDRAFLYELAKDPKSLIKPQNLPHVDIIKDKAMLAKVEPKSFKQQVDFTPNFIKPLARPGGRPSQTKPGMRDGPKGPQGGGRNASMGGGAPRVINLPVRQDAVELNKAENAWKRANQAGAAAGAGEADPLEEVAKQTLAILNKLTPQKFDTLIQKFNKITIDTEAKLRKCIDLIFEKAVDEQGFAEEYAKMCKHLSEKHVMENDQPVNFRKLLIGRCQIEFEKDYMEGLDKDKYKEELAKAETEEKKKEIQEDFEDKERKARRRSAGNTRFIGELYKRDMLTVRIMHECIRRLIQKADEESLECLCRLVTTVGKHLEDATEHALKMKAENPNKLREVVALDGYFTQMQKIIDQKLTTLRVRCLLMDVIDLRKNKWVPRRKVAGPKTIDQIHKDIEKEKEKQQFENLAYQGNTGSSRSLGGRDNFQNSGRSQDGRKRSQRGGPQQDNDGWSMPIAKPASARKDFDKSYLGNLSSMSSGPRDPGSIFGNRPGGFGTMWGKGSGTKASTPQQPQLTSTNRFGLLLQDGGGGGGAAERSVSPSVDARNRLAGSSRSVGGNAMGRGHAREEAIAAVRNFNKPLPQSAMASNGPSSLSSAAAGGGAPGAMSGGGYAPRRDASAAAAASVATGSEFGESDAEIADNQRIELKGDKFAADTDRLETRLKSIIEEYIHQPNVDEVKLGVKESCKIDNMAFCVEFWINEVLEKKAGARNHLGYFLVLLVKEKLLQRSQVIEGLSTVLEIAVDMICDIPKMWEVLGELIAPLLESRRFSMKMLSVTAPKIAAGEVGIDTGRYVEGVLRQLCKKIGEKKVAEMWIEACLDWSKFLPKDMIPEFVKDHKLEYTQPASASAASSDASAVKTPSDFKAELIKVLESDSSTNHTETNKFIDMYLKSRKEGSVPDNTFIRMLTVGVTRSCLEIKRDQNTADSSQQIIQAKFSRMAFEKKANILKRILSQNREWEKQALYSLQGLMTELEYPSRMLQEIFDTLHDCDLISRESFEAWEKCDDPAEQEGKGVAIKSTVQFFTMLKEDGSDNEDDE